MLGAGVVTVYRQHMPETPAAACPATASAMTRLELLFGMGRKQGGEVSEGEWRTFLDEEVTPRFPEGLTVLAASGQWRGKAGDVTKEPSRMLLIWYVPGPDSEAKIGAIRAAYKARFEQDSVLRVDALSCVSF
jgi:hypothetical protein